MPDRRFKWLLWLFPASFREDHEREILRVWREEQHDAAAEGRRGVWKQALRDTLRVAPREYVAAVTHNLAIAFRALRKAPAFGITAVLTLGLGIGATAAVFSLLSGVVLRPLPWQHAEAVGLVWAIPPSGNRTWLSAPELEEIRQQIRSFSGVAGFTDVRFAHIGKSQVTEVQGLAVSQNFFRVIGVTLAYGRDFTPDEDHTTAARSVILSHEFWQSQLGGDSQIVGRTIRLTDHDYTVVGIAPASFEWLPPSSVIPGAVDLWVTLEPHLVARDRTLRLLHALARLREGTTFDAATAELNAYGERVRSQFTDVYTGGRWTFAAVSFQADTLSGTRASLYAVFGLVVLVLIMACGNVANLLLARGESRRRDVIVRSALGAGPARLAGELMAEALVLAMLGSIVGLGMAAAVPKLIRFMDPAALPRLDGVTTDWRVGLAILSLILFTSVLFAAFPMMERLRLRSSGALVADRSGIGSPRAIKVGRALVIVQTTLAVAVLVSAVFLADTFQRLQRADVGFDPARVISARIAVFTPPPGRSPAQYFESVVEAIERTPGVEHAAAVSQLPLSGAMLGSTFLGGDASDDRRIDVDLRGVTPGYFGVMGIPVLRGRGLAARDTATTPSVAVVDEAFARALSPDGQVIGRRVRWFRQPQTEIEIVGVVGAVRHRSLEEMPRPTVYRPLPQYPRTSMYVVAKTNADPSPVDRIIAAVATVTPAQPVADVATMEDRIGRAASRARTSVMLAATLAGLAVILAVVGVYGVLSFGVAQRRREFGVRLALGASPASIRRMILRDGFVLTAAGCVFGTVSAWTIVRGARSLLFENTPGDLAPYVVGVLFVAMCSLGAFWIPARRASTINPSVALRQD